MSDRKHTSGQWRVSAHKGTLHVHTSDAAVCDVRGREEDGEVQANARLLASAPRLLEALEPFAEAALRWEGSEAKGHRYGIPPEDWAAARAAIAQAKS